MAVTKQPLTFQASGALAPHLRVSLDGSNQLEAAGATTEELGTLLERAHAADQPMAVEPAQTGIVVLMVAAGAFDKYAAVYGAAAGRVDDTANEHYIGLALEASGGAGAIVRVLRLHTKVDIDPLGEIDGNVLIDDDFIGDYPAAGTDLPADSWTKTETLGLGVIGSDEPNGVLKFVFDAVAEVALSELFMENSPIHIDGKPVIEFIAAVEDEGDDAALDIDWGVASDNSADGDFESIAAFAAFHVDGSSLALKVHSDDGVTDVAPTATGKTLTQGQYYAFRIDLSDPEDVKFYYRALGDNDWERLAATTTFDLSGYATGTLTPIVMVEKTSNDTTADFRLDRVRVQCGRYVA